MHLSAGAILDPAQWQALALSLRVAVLCTLINVIPGVLIAWLLARTRFPGRSVLDAIVHLPLVLPPVVVGYALLLLLGRNSAIGSWLESTLGWHIAFTWYAAVLASAAMGFPLLVRPLRLAIELIDSRLEQAAATLGASPWRVFFTVTLPLALPGLLTGLTLCFARSLGEFGATITFAGNIPGQTRTLPLALYTDTQTPGGDASAIRLMIVSIIISFAALLVSEYLARRVMRRGRPDGGGGRGLRGSGGVA